MKDCEQFSDVRPVSCGELNRKLGWSLVLIAFVTGLYLDPWSLAERDASVWLGSAQMYARHVQAVLLGMGFMNVAVARILCRTPTLPRTHLVVTLLTCGTIIYCGSYLAGIAWPLTHWLVPLGAILNLAGFVVWLGTLYRRSVPILFPTVLIVFSFGMLLDAAMGLLAAVEPTWQLEPLGSLDDVSLRMMRLARAAVIALSLLALLYDELLVSSDRRLRWGLYSLLIGAVSMPFLLVSAAVVFVPLKYLLGLPAQLAMLGVMIGVVLAATRTSAWEAWGWLIVATGMSVGMFMGLYAFDGPLRAPEFLGEYNDWHRRFSRLGHAYLIVLGLICILQSRRAWGFRKDDRSRSVSLIKAGVGLIGMATLVIPGLIWTVPARNLPTIFLALGPALAALGIALCLWPHSDTQLRTEGHAGCK